MDAISRNLFLIEENIKRVCHLHQLKRSQINLVAASKSQDQTKILDAIGAGVKTFGENYVQEAERKWPEIKARHPEIKLHFIGHLQTNKVKQVLKLFDCIETLDSEKLAIAFGKELGVANPEFFIQVNIGEEKQKAGVAPNELASFVNFAKHDCKLNVTGLMAIPPANEFPSPYFALLNNLAKQNNLANLSMGMSADYESAIALGANYIRLGTAIFGSRSLGVPATAAPASRAVL